MSARVAFKAALILATVFACLAVGCALAAIWSGDDRWWLTCQTFGVAAGASAFAAAASSVFRG